MRFDFDRISGVNRRDIEEYISLSFIEQNQNLVFLGHLMLVNTPCGFDRTRSHKQRVENVFYDSAGTRYVP
ncbi:ATP-binding protein [Thalassobacillus sp. CUG 92003]|uniref:ATP-binding protein n=1 Tax=Thalassobacillus sp. CUG 92003 TaxID=2736641 RepID=UPI00351A5CE7